MDEATKQVLLAVCDSVGEAQRKAGRDRRHPRSEESIYTELLVMRDDKIRVEIRKENVAHNEPHMHITHSDKIDVSISLNNFRILAGIIDNRTLRYLLHELRPRQPQLKAIWESLNEEDDCAEAQKLISSLFG